MRRYKKLMMQNGCIFALQHSAALTHSMAIPRHLFRARFGLIGISPKDFYKPRFYDPFFTESFRGITTACKQFRDKDICLSTTCVLFPSPQGQVRGMGEKRQMSPELNHFRRPHRAESCECDSNCNCQKDRSNFLRFTCSQDGQDCRNKCDYQKPIRVHVFSFLLML